MDSAITDYAGYRTRTFRAIFPDYATFKTSTEAFITPNYLLTAEAPKAPSPEEIYFLIASEYSNSHIASSDESRFIMKISRLLYQYAPELQKQIQMQADLLGASEEDFRSETETINNTSFNPAGEVDVDEYEKISTVNQQNAALTRKSKARAYAEVFALLNSDAITRFLDRFKDLFITYVEPTDPLLYPDIEEV